MLHSSKYGSQNTFVKFEPDVFRTTSCYAHLLSLCCVHISWDI